ncbi:hypothetical protein SU65_06925 [Flavobacterium psychrophilum]|nr:hypothetical protein SU65_06925 [Flavobacterium psychrophilum]
MEVDKLDSYQTIISYLKKKSDRERHLLLGNGFSMAYDPKIFSYNALSTFVESSSDEFLKKLFSVLKTKNFELIMDYLDNFCEIAKVFSEDKTLVAKIENANENLKSSLIEAVKSLHPEHVFSISDEKSRKCFKFLEDYLSNNGNIFSTNYDLLLYWVLLRNESKFHIDGFGRELENPNFMKLHEEPEFGDLIWGVHKDKQNVHYNHGALQLFDTGIEIIKEVYDSNNLLENISNRMDKKEYPIFVTAGNANEKLNHIMHNKYLSTCYDNLSNISGSLVTFGFSFSDNDTHIISAINKACKFNPDKGTKLLSIYIGVFSDDSLAHLKKIEKDFACKVNYYNARTANIW